MKLFILAGGSGTRLWPLSRSSFPKQFLKIKGETSLLQQSVLRATGVCKAEDIFVLTNSDYQFLVRDQLKEIDEALSENIILEPCGKNTAPAIVLGMQELLQNRQCQDDEVVMVTTSDHVIQPVAQFENAMRQAEAAAVEGNLVTFGVQPTAPETGYGYIKADRDCHKTPYSKVLQFVEKPDLSTAEKYIEEGNYYWNSGMFAFKISTFREELSRYCPDVASLFEKDVNTVIEEFHTTLSISVDYAVMEHTEKAVVLPLDLNWSDVGSWDSLYELSEKDHDSNVIEGNVIAKNTRNSLIVSKKKLVTTIGIEDLVIIETEDALLVSRKGEAQKVKDIVNTLKDNDYSEADDHVTTFRPWGSYTILEEGSRYKVKRIKVSPGAKLSLQLHFHRSEHWVVIKGTAKVRVGEKEMFLHENQSTFVPKSSLHRLENPGKVPLEIIEVQVGEYVDEDDIQRFDDDYGRENG